MVHRTPNAPQTANHVMLFATLNFTRHLLKITTKAQKTNPVTPIATNDSGSVADLKIGPTVFMKIESFASPDNSVSGFTGTQHLTLAHPA